MRPPIVILGSGRSGTTLLLRLLAHHEALAWPSNWMARVPSCPWLAVANRLYELPYVGRLLLKSPLRRLCAKPSEAQPFWRRYIPDFYERARRGGGAPGDEPLSPGDFERLRRVVATACWAQGKQQFLLKVVGTSRVPLFRAAFRAPWFVHIVRDPRAVVCSLLDRWRHGNWRWLDDADRVMREWPEAHRRAWQREYRGPLAFLAFHWASRVSAILDDLRGVPAERCVMVRYHDLVDRPAAELTRIATSCGLPTSDRMVRAARAEGLRNMNYKWREQLDEQQAAMIEAIVSQCGLDEYLAPGAAPTDPGGSDGEPQA